MSRLADGIYGQDEPLKALYKAFSSNPQGFALLFSGPSGIGKKLVARAFAQDLLCEKNANDIVIQPACGICGSCLRIAKNQSESVLLIEPDQDKVNAPIKIEQAQQILEFLSLRSTKKFRIVIIDQCHMMNTQAANALLKSIEEPPEGTFYFLITSNISSVLATIKSRCRVLHFKALPLNLMREKAGGPSWVISASRGSFEKLAELQEVSDDDFRSLSSSLLQEFLFDESFLTENPWREKLKDRNAAARLVGHWAQFLRDAVFLELKAEDHILSPDQKISLKKISSVNSQQLLSLAQECAKIGFEISQQKDAVLLIESFWVRKENGVFG